jgi:hypothetical protein
MNIQRVTLALGPRHWRDGRILATALLISLLLGTMVLALTAQSYAISWWTIDGGGATMSTSGGYSLGGTIGQPDAGLLVGGRYTLDGGFWAGTVTSYSCYLPLVLHQD